METDNYTFKGFSVTAKLLAYGGIKSIPFQRGIFESQAIAVGITGTCTRDSMQRLTDYVGCNDPALTTASQRRVATSVDGDFKPAPPSTLLREGCFARIPAAVIGWTQDDMTLYTSPSIASPEQTYQTIRGKYPLLSEENLATLLSLYPVSDFPANATANRTAESYHAARIWRDVLMVCQPLHVAEALSGAGSDVYLYNWNQTIAGPALAAVRGLYGVGVPHTAEFAYTFGNLSAYDVNGYPFNPAPEDFALQHRAARSWSAFASTGRPWVESRDTFLGWEKAFPSLGGGGGGGDTPGQPHVWVAGGPNEGLSAVDGSDALPEMAEQKIRKRCAFINSPEMIEQLKY